MTAASAINSQSIMQKKRKKKTKQAQHSNTQSRVHPTAAIFPDALPKLMSQANWSVIISTQGFSRGSGHMFSCSLFLPRSLSHLPLSYTQTHTYAYTCVCILFFFLQCIVLPAAAPSFLCNPLSSTVCLCGGTCVAGNAKGF